MPKVILCLCLTLLTTFSAKGQWWQLKHYPRLAPLMPAKSAGFDFAETIPSVVPVYNQASFPRTAYNYEVTEAAIMKSLYHSLRFHVTADIIKGFDQLVELYIQQQRFSEAKWYLLQCNAILRQQNDSPSLIASLVSLGMLKCDIGEYDQARQDLMEAYNIALSAGRQNDISEINKKLYIIEIKKNLNIKIEQHYADIDAVKKS